MGKLLKVAGLGLLLLIATACESGSQRTTTETTQTAVVTPNVELTVQAAVAGTVQAQPKPAVSKPAATVAPVARAPTASPTPKAQAKVEATDVTDYKNSIGGTVVIGMVKNTGDIAASGIEIAITLVGNDGSTVGVGSAFIKPAVLKPGGRAGWSASIQGAEPFKETRVQVQAQPVGGFLGAGNTQDLKIEGASTRAAAGGMTWAAISGQVVNTGQKPASSIHLIASIFAADGTLLEVDNGSPKLQEIAPGQSAPFEITFIGGRGIEEISKYELFIEGTSR